MKNFYSICIKCGSEDVIFVDYKIHDCSEGNYVEPESEDSIHVCCNDCGSVISVAEQNEFIVSKCIESDEQYDFYRELASRIYDKDIETITSQERSKVKKSLLRTIYNGFGQHSSVFSRGA